jgi:zinc carboxypeptidase/carboxypeptidase family protein/flagellar hook capping protein FlgD
MMRHPGNSLILLILLLCATAAWAQIPLDKAGLPQWQIRTWTDFPVNLDLADQAELTSLLGRVPIASFNREQIRPVRHDDGRTTLLLKTRVTEAELAALREAGYQPRQVRDIFRENREATERKWLEMSQDKSLNKSITPLNYYPTYDQVGTLLADVAAAHSTLARTFSWGSSHQGRLLQGLVLSGNVNVDEAEPEVRLVASIHGDEPVGMVMLINLARYLTENYGVVGYEDVTYLMDNYEMHFMPLYNPDGYVLGRRQNANYVDLNRNFMEPAGTQPYMDTETLAFVAYNIDKHFVISENAHGGALVVNYPWDYTYTLAPDDAALQDLSLEYSTYNLPMYNGAFANGITNGAAWYVANGTLQDWSYDQTGCIDLTLELSDTKWPADTTLGTFWNENRESLMHFIKSARYGINGVVEDAVTGLPLDAEISVAGNTKPVNTDPDNGDYYKLLATGVYDVTVSAAGYTTQTITGVATTWGVPTVLDVALDSIQSSTPPPVYSDQILSAAPNPFNPKTRIDFEVGRSGPVSLVVHDALGRRVAELVRQPYEPGRYHVYWDGRNSQGAKLPSGVYFARFQGLQTDDSLKLVLVR